VVVTSDNEIIAAAQGRGIVARKCKDFAAMLIREARPKPHDGINAHVRVSPNEVEAWLEVFGEGDDLAPPPVERPRVPRQNDDDAADTGSPAAESPAASQGAAPDLRADSRSKHTPHLNEDEIAAWLDAFGEYEPDVDLKEQLKRDRYVARRRKPASEAGSPPRNGKIKQNRSAARYQPPAEKQKGTEEDPYISKADVDLFLDLFSDEDE
jgi:hypothetical protein